MFKFKSAQCDWINDLECYIEPLKKSLAISSKELFNFKVKN